MILIVDDDRTIRLSLGLMLRQGGFDSIAVGTEDEAITAIRSGGIELVILDMNLTLSTTGRQGLDIIQGIRILAPDVPVIMLSAWATVPLAVQGMGYGAVDFVTKPWNNRDFMARIRETLRRSKALEESKEHSLTLEASEREAIVRALRRTDGNMTEAARMLGITRQSLYRRMEKFGLKE